MLAYTARLTQSKFIRNVAIVATGTASAQALNIVFAPILARLYGPESFGVLGTFMAILGVLAPLGAFCYPFAIVLPKNRSDAAGIARMSLIIALCTSFLFAVVFLTFGKQITNLFNIQTLEPLLLLFPLAMLFAVCSAVASQWVIREKLFKLKAKVAFLQALWLNGAKAGVGMVWPTAVVLVVLATLGALIHAFMLYTGVKKKNHRSESDENRVESLIPYRELAWRHRDFPYFRAPQMVLNAASQSMPILMLASFFGPAAAGFYSLGRMVMAAPSLLVGNAVGDVFYPRIAEAAQRGEPLTPLVVKATMILLAIGVLPFGIVALAGPSLFSFVFGGEWLVAGEYARWLAFWLLFMFANQPSIKSLPVLAAQHFHLIFTSFTVLLRAASLAVGYYVFSNDVVAVAIYALVSMCLNILLICLTVGLCVKNDRSIREV